MVELWARRAAVYLKKVNPEETASVAVMTFALIGLLNTAITLVSALLLSIPLQAFEEVVWCLLGFMALRFFSGGIHLPKPWMCNVVSVAIIVGSALLPVPQAWVPYLTGIAAALLLLFAPSNMEGHARIPRRYFGLLKLVSVLIVLANLWLDHPALSAVFLAQSLLVIHIPRKGGSIR